MMDGFNSFSLSEGSLSTPAFIQFYHELLPRHHYLRLFPHTTRASVKTCKKCYVLIITSFGKVNKGLVLY